MLNWIKKLWPSKRTTTVVINNNTLDEIFDAATTGDEYGDILTISNIPDPIIYGNVDSQHVLLLVDDQESVFYLYDIDFETIRTTYGYDVLSHYKIVKCVGADAGFIASKYLLGVVDELVVAVLDLTLGKVLKLPGGEIATKDGVDIALEILDIQPKCAISFCTAHLMKKDNLVIEKLINKFNTVTGRDLLEYTFSKNSDRAKYLHRLITAIDLEQFTDIYVNSSEYP